MVTVSVALSTVFMLPTLIIMSGGHAGGAGTSIAPPIGADMPTLSSI
jgi:hypothetical protein